jgi:hypothetical protein
MARRTPPRKVTHFEPVAPRLARNTVIVSTFEVGRRFRCTMRVDCRELDPVALIRPEPGEWHPRMPALVTRSLPTGAPAAAYRPDHRRTPRDRRRIGRAFAKGNLGGERRGFQAGHHIDWAPQRCLCLAVTRGGAYCFGGGGNGSRTGSGLILARMAFKVLMRGDMKQRSLTLLHGSVVRRRGLDGVSGPRF